MKCLRQAGDTIVEVLIAITVASTILTGAFVSARHSLTGTRQSQERVEALKVAEEQLEKLREISANPGNYFTNSSAMYNATCIDTSSPPMVHTLAPIYSASSENFGNGAAHPAACIRSSSGVMYYPVIQRSAVSGGYTFIVIVHWDKVGGGSVEELTLAYRLYI